MVVVVVVGVVVDVVVGVGVGMPGSRVVVVPAVLQAQAQVHPPDRRRQGAAPVLPPLPLRPSPAHSPCRLHLAGWGKKQRVVCVVCEEAGERQPRVQVKAVN